MDNIDFSCCRQCGQLQPYMFGDICDECIELNESAENLGKKLAEMTLTPFINQVATLQKELAKVKLKLEELKGIVYVSEIALESCIENEHFCEDSLEVRMAQFYHEDDVDKALSKIKDYKTKYNH